MHGAELIPDWVDHVCKRIQRSLQSGMGNATSDATMWGVSFSAHMHTGETDTDGF
jgi:hypothetical protein